MPVPWLIFVVNRNGMVSGGQAVQFAGTISHLSADADDACHIHEDFPSTFVDDFEVLVAFHNCFAAGNAVFAAGGEQEKGKCEAN